MNAYFPLTAAAALMTLTACGQSQPEVVDNKAPDAIGAQVAQAAPVELPPAVKDSRSYRCKDNSIIYVDFLADDKSANLRTDKAGTPTALKADAPGKPYKSDGFEVVGSGTSITATIPGKGTQDCKA
ncbi:hypothetical protein [Rhizorhapis sp.]|uniref:hypothetical protein n=1 Tax=Rhizorhapis sp. TaxID=1968842 RepID=UPI002B46E846|nr:hypothetical protein [Rhizorhapis sp.]HKR18250.1 hypothetical protein [Rhizorhapis sp.]